MRTIITTFLFLLFISGTEGQVTVLKDGDSTYQNRVIFEGMGNTGIWEFKSDLPKGKYWVIEQTECGPDTLKYAEFLHKGIKHGTWTEWESGLCFGAIKGKSVSWSFASEKEKYNETVYDSGYLVKSTFYYIESNQPHWEFLYPKYTTKENEWIEKRIWRENGSLKEVTKVMENKKSKRTSYYQSGQVETSGIIGENGYEGVWEHFYKNGKLRGKGEYEPLGPKGLWQYWDKKGKLIAEVTFEKGRPKEIKKYQKKEILLIDVNENNDVPNITLDPAGGTE